MVLSFDDSVQIKKIGIKLKQNIWCYYGTICFVFFYVDTYFVWSKISLLSKCVGLHLGQIVLWNQMPQNLIKFSSPV